MNGVDAQSPLIVYASIAVAIVSLLWNNRDAISGLTKSIFGFGADLRKEKLGEAHELLITDRKLYETRLGVALTEMEGLRKQYNDNIKLLQVTQEELMKTRMELSDMQFQLHEAQHKIARLEGEHKHG